MTNFRVGVTNLVEAKLLLNALALYDLFQYENNIKPDYCNAGGLQIYCPEIITESDGEGNGWIDYYSEEGRGIDEYELEELRRELPKWEMEPSPSR